jgi:hypothetical protein
LACNAALRMAELGSKHALSMSSCHPARAQH